MLNGFSEKFEVTTKISGSSYHVYLREICFSDSATPPLHISLQISSDRKSYKLECFEVKNRNKNEEEYSRIHSFNVDGPWNLKMLEADLLKIIKREFKTFRPRYYPF